MHPTLFVQETAFGRIPYNTWGLMITIAFLVATLTAQGRAAKVGIDPDKMVGVYLVAIFTGLVGARLLHFLMATPDVFFVDPLIFFRLWQGGFAFYGGFILAGFCVVTYGIRRGMDPWKLADVMAPVVMLGLAFGRIGCFSAGCCHGMEAVLPADAIPLLSGDDGQLWVFPHAPFLLEMTRHGVGDNDVVVYPTQLWESLAALVIFAVTSILFRHRRFDGQVFGTVLLLYSIWRPINESMRGDDVRGTGYLGFLTTSQLISIPVFVVAVVVLLSRFGKGIKPEIPYRAEAQDIGAAPRI